MIDEILVGIFGEAVFGKLGESRRAQLIARVLIGLVGTGLGLAGAIIFWNKSGIDNTAMQACMIAVFVFLACFCLFNIALARKWRWPGVLFLVSFVALFVSRFLFGP